MRRSITTRRGFALLVVIALITILAMALVALGLVLSRQARRTATLREDVQLRQMLLAGGVAVQQRAQNWGAEVPESRFPVELPKALAGDGATLVVHIGGSDGAQVLVHVEGKLGDRSMRQTLKMVRKATTWQVEESRLGE